MAYRRKHIVATLVFVGCLIPPMFLVLASRLVAGFDVGSWYRPETVSTLPAATFTLIEQLVICIAAFGLKPIYELLAIVLLVRLWKNDSHEIIALRYGLIAFFLGESACALNYLMYRENSFALEYLHIYGMVVCFAFVSYAALIAIDRRILKYSLRDEKCAFLFFCRRCYKHHQISCTLRRLYQLFAVAAVVITFIPITARLGGYHVVGNVFGTSTVFGHSLAQQILETRIWPTIAAFFFVLSWTVLQIRKENGFETAKILLSAGLGLLGFSLMRFFVFWGFEHNPVWADAWEEITEFLFMGSLYFFFFMSRDKRKKE